MPDLGADSDSDEENGEERDVGDEDNEEDED